MEVLFDKFVGQLFFQLKSSQPRASVSGTSNFKMRVIVLRAPTRSVNVRTRQSMKRIPRLEATSRCSAFTEAQHHVGKPAGPKVLGASTLSLQSFHALPSTHLWSLASIDPSWMVAESPYWRKHSVLVAGMIPISSGACLWAPFSRTFQFPTSCSGDMDLGANVQLLLTLLEIKGDLADPILTAPCSGIDSSRIIVDAGLKHTCKSCNSLHVPGTRPEYLIRDALSRYHARVSKTASKVYPNYPRPLSIPSNPNVVISQ